MRSWDPRASSRPVSGGCGTAALGANRHHAGQPPSSTPNASDGSSGSNTSVTRRSSRNGSSSSSSSGINAAGDLAAARARWLPDQPTFVCPPITATEGSPVPSDEAWAERGIFLSYGKAHLSYHDVEELLQLANLDISPAEFRAATAVVWAYRYRPDDSTTITAKKSASAEPGTSSQQACTNGGGNAVGSCWERSSVGDGDGGGGAPGIELVGFASADVAPAPGPPPSAALAVAAGAGDGAAGGASGGSGGGGRSRRRRRADAETIAGPGRQGLPAIGIPQRNVSTDGGGGGGAATATIWYLAVHPSLRRQGLGRALLERLVSGLYDSRSGVPPPLMVSLRATSRSAAFYDRLGLRRDRAAPLVRNAGGSGSGNG